MITPRIHPYSLEIYRADFRLEIWYRGPGKKQPRLAEYYSIAVGRVGHETPAGRYKVTAKARNPEWKMPNSDWVEPALRGTVIPGGADNNPIKVAFLRVVDDPTGNIGIHGTADLASLGSAASHGCIRVHPDVANSLYHRIPVGTPVHIY